MAWVALDRNGDEFIYGNRPERWNHLLCWGVPNDTDTWIELPKGSIRNLIGRELTWHDKPVELK